MSRRNGIILLSVITFVVITITVIVWVRGRAYDDKVADCRNALTSSSTKTNRPSACEGVKADDYEALLIVWSLRHAFEGMPKTDRDMPDHYDNGTIDGSIG